MSDNHAPLSRDERKIIVDRVLDPLYCGADVYLILRYEATVVALEAQLQEQQGEDDFERQEAFLLSELGSLDRMIGRLPAYDSFERPGLLERRERVQAELKALQEAIAECNVGRAVAGAVAVHRVTHPGTALGAVPATTTEYQKLMLPLFDDPETGCIKHWETLLEGKRADEDVSGSVCPWADQCSLCTHFSKNTGCVKCRSGCPIYLRTNAPNCAGTPYTKAQTAWRDNVDIGNVPSGDAARAIKAMLDYLKETREMVASGELKPEEEQ